MDKNERKEIIGNNFFKNNCYLVTYNYNFFSSTLAVIKQEFPGAKDADINLSIRNKFNQLRPSSSGTKRAAKDESDEKDDKKKAKVVL